MIRRMFKFASAVKHYLYDGTVFEFICKGFRPDLFALVYFLDCPNLYAIFLF